MITLCRLLFLSIIMSLLTACAIFHTTKQEDHEAICKELKRQIIWNGTNGAQQMWNGATGDQMLSTQQRAERETLMKNYREEGC